MGGRTLDQTDGDWPAVRWNIMWSSLVWGRLGALLQREGADPRLEEIFYRSVFQAIFLYGLETCVVLAAMEKKVEGAHTGFLRHITGKRARRVVDGTWEKPSEEVVQEVVGTHSAMNYIGR